MTLSYTTDIAILGGGVAGLCLLDRLRSAGYSAVLLESGALGGGQTVASQGIIHGGLKYALGGSLSGAAQAIAAMPARWRAMLAGAGEMDLSSVPVLSDNYYMWSGASFRSRLKAFLGSKSLRGRVEAVSRPDFPGFFAQSDSGRLFRLPDFVIDTRFLVAHLAATHADRLFKVEDERPEFERDEQGRVCAIVLWVNDQRLRLAANQFVFTAGAGNAGLITLAGLDGVRQQRRPLHMVWVSKDGLEEVYAHCIGTDFSLTPELTVTSHRQSDGRVLWYLGGELAESGVARSEAEQIIASEKLLRRIFPWQDWKGADWHSLRIDRAEPAIENGRRPDDTFIHQERGVIVGWPTKLTLAPRLSDKVIDSLKTRNIEPAISDPSPEIRRCLPVPEIAEPCWGNQV